MMRKKTRSILEELNNMVVERDRVHVIENRGQNIIESAMNLIKMIRESYDQETAADLEKRLINAIRTSDPKKFARGVKRMRDE